MEAELRHVDDRLTLARQEAASPLANSWGEFPGLVELAGSEDARVRLAAVLRRVVDSISCLFVPVGENRVAAVQVHFTGGKHRSYFILHRPARQLTKEKKRAPSWYVKSFADAGLPSIDLRKPTDAAKVQKLLASIDVKKLTG
jgi:hypothetical protein